MSQNALSPVSEQNPEDPGRIAGMQLNEWLFPPQDPSRNAR